MYANLLASAMTASLASEVHPAFVHVIQQLTPDEAIVLQAIATSSAGLNLHELVDQFGDYIPPSSSVKAQFRSLCEAAQVKAPSLSEAYLDNLLRLRLFAEVRWSEGKLGLQGNLDYGTYQTDVVNLDGRLVELSSFGEAFLRTCVLPAAG